MLSDCHSAALVERTGSIDWWCVPRFDSPSVFARILDDDGGHFSITPQQVVSTTRAYERDSLVLRTTVETETGVAEIRDALLMAEGPRGHDLGIGSPHVLARHLRCLEGSVDLDVEFFPRFEYALTFPLVSRRGDVVFARGGATTLVLSTSAELEIEDGSRASANLTLEGATRRDSPFKPSPPGSHSPDIDRTRPSSKDSTTPPKPVAIGSPSTSTATGHISKSSVNGCSRLSPTDPQERWLPHHHFTPRGRGRGEELGLPLLLD